jgi:hypothetical protein
MIKSKLSPEEVKQKKKSDTKKPKPYPVPEEDSFIPPDDDSAEIKYVTKEKLDKKE